MKKIGFTLTLSLFAALACSCGNEEGRAEKAAYKYLDAIGNYDFDRAWDYATEETQKSTLTLFRDVIMPTTDMDYVNSNRPAKITISQVSITDDTCAEAFFHESTPIQEQDGSITVVDYKTDRVTPSEIPARAERYRTQLQICEDALEKASPSERVKLNRQIAKFKDQAMELREHEEKIHHLADQMIKIDLDDGVKHNYEIFKDVLAKIK